MSGKVRTKQDKTGEIIAYSEGAVRNNAAVVEYCKISMAALSGGMAGLLGLTSFYGFGFYIFAVVALWAMLLIKAGGHWKKYFISRYSLLTNGFFGGLFSWQFGELFAPVSLTKVSITMAQQTYVLFWTFLYGMVHVY